MADIKEVVQLAVDYHNNSVVKYSKGEARELIREALIEANGGSTNVTAKSFRRNPELFTIVEEIIQRTVASGLAQNDFFNNWVDVRNLAEGDSINFVIPKDYNYVVADISRGNQAISRQRFVSETTVSLIPTPKAVRIYDELTRVLSGRADINDMIAAVTKAVEQKRLNEIYTAWNGITAATIGSDFYPTAGTFSEATLLGVCEKVMAANDTDRIQLVGTRAALRGISMAQAGDAIKDDYYNRGYMLMWNGIPTDRKSVV